MAGREEKTSGRVQEQTPFHFDPIYPVDRIDPLDQIAIELIQLILTFLHHLCAQTPTPNVHILIILTTYHKKFSSFCI